MLVYVIGFLVLRACLSGMFGGFGGGLFGRGRFMGRPFGGPRGFGPHGPMHDHHGFGPGGRPW